MSIKATVNGTAYSGITTINAGGKAITLAETGTIATPTATKTQSITKNGTISVDVTNYKTITITTNVSSSGGSSDSGSDEITFSELTYSIISGASIATNAGRVAYFACDASASYTINKGSASRFITGYTTELPANGVQVKNVDSTTGSSHTVSTGSDAAYIVIYYCFNVSDDAAAEQLNSITVVKN